MFEKSNNPELNPDLKLNEQNPTAIDRLIKGIQRKDLGLYCSNKAARDGLCLVKYMIEQHGFPECFFTFSIAENQLKWIATNLKT